MITNQRQYGVTRSEVRRFEAAIADAETGDPAEGIDPRLHQAMIEGLRGQLDDLRRELREYDALREGKIKRRVVTSLLEFPNALIEGRIVRRLTQRELAAKLGLLEQQIQRYEQTLYAGVAIDRLQQVADALGIRMKKTIDYEPGTASRSSGRSAKAATRSRKRRGAHAFSARSRVSLRAAKTSKALSDESKGGERMAGKRTGKAAGSAAGKTLASKSSSKTAKRAAASDLAQVGNQKVTGKKAASAAGKTLASKSASKTAKRAAASDLSQATRTKKKR